jgi:XTP/dITP diphosphohydrolase
MTYAKLMKKICFAVGHAMNSLGTKTGLCVTSPAGLQTHPPTLSTPILVTPLTTQDELRAILRWLQPQVSATHPLTLVYATGESATYGLSELESLESLDNAHCPTQVYIPAQPTAELEALQELIAVVAQLRHPENGCPWDLAQTPETLIPYVLEEAYETVDAIRQGSQPEIAEELGDLLLQVVLQAQIASEAQHFSLQEVAQGISQKLIRRHPHVFGNVQVSSVEEVHAHWDAIKAAEKGISTTQPESLSYKLERKARRLPPLMAGLKLSEKAAAAGFEWPDMESVWAKFHEELEEFQEALRQGSIAEQEAELGDVLFTLVNIARWCQIDPAAALHLTNLKLVARIRAIESQTDRPLNEHTLAELETLWQRVKQQLRATATP